MANQFISFDLENATITNSNNPTAGSFPKEASSIAAICAILFSVFGVVGNLLTILALLKSPKLRAQATTWFVISLSVSDMIFCAFNLPLTATRFIFEAWIFGKTLCKIFPLVFYANFGASVLHIMLIAINRCILISNYQLYKKVYNLSYTITMSFAAWIFSFLILLAPFLGVWGTMGLDEATYSCTILKKDGTSPKKLIFLLGIVLPLIIVAICYGRIYCIVQRSKRVLRRIQLATEQPCVSSSQSKKDDYKLTKTMGFIFGGFIVCFLPLMVVNVIDDLISHPAIHIAASIAAWASAVINPIIYSVTSKSYRQAYYALLGWNKQPSGTRMTSGGARTTTSDVGILS